MTEPVVIVLGATPLALLGLACLVLVTVLAVLDYRRRGRLFADARRSVEQAAQSIRDMTIPPTTWKDY